MNDSSIVYGEDDLNRLLAYFGRRDTLTSLACRDFFENRYNFDDNDDDHSNDEDDDEGNANEDNNDDNDDGDVWQIGGDMD